MGLPPAVLERLLRRDDLALVMSSAVRRNDEARFGVLSALSCLDAGVAPFSNAPGREEVCAALNFVAPSSPGRGGGGGGGGGPRPGRGGGGGGGGGT